MYFLQEVISWQLHLVTSLVWEEACYPSSQAFPLPLWPLCESHHVCRMANKEIRNNNWALMITSTPWRNGFTNGYDVSCLGGHTLLNTCSLFGTQPSNLVISTLTPWPSATPLLAAILQWSGYEVGIPYRWISWCILPWELEGITSPCCLLIRQFPHHMTLCPPVAIVKRCFGIHLYSPLESMADVTSTSESALERVVSIVKSVAKGWD